MLKTRKAGKADDYVNVLITELAQLLPQLYQLLASRRPCRFLPFVEIVGMRAMYANMYELSDI